MPKRSRGPIGHLCLGFFLAALLGFSEPQASCGSANCFLVTGTEEAVNNPGEVSLDFSCRYIPQDRKLSGTHSVNEVLVPKVNFEDGIIEPDHHREISTENILERHHRHRLDDASARGAGMRFRREPAVERGMGSQTLNRE